MKISPEALDVMASYRETQFSFAISYLEQYGKIKRELAELTNEKDQILRRQLEALSREEKLRDELKALKSEHDIYQKNVEIKFQELENNIEQQKRSTDEMKIRLNEEREMLLKVISEKDSKYKEAQKQSDERIRELEKELRKNRKIPKIPKLKDGKGTCVIN